MDFDRVIQLFQALERENVHYVLVGGVALNMYGIPRATQDIDLFVRTQRENDLVADNLVWNGVNVRVATPQTLYKMKKDTLRPVDQADAAELRERFGLRED